MRLQLKRVASIVLLWGVLSGFATEEASCQPAWEAQQCPLCGELRRLLEAAYPTATINLPGLDTSGLVELSVDLANLAPAAVVPGIRFADTSNIELLARAVINATKDLHGVDPLSLVVSGAHFSGRGDWFATNVYFRQCYNGVPVNRSWVDFRVSERGMTLRFRNLLKHPQCVTIANLSLDSAIAVIESAERNRVEAGTRPRPVTSYGIVSTKLFDEFYDMRDSSGRWIPYAERAVGSELVIFADSSSTQIRPALSWHIGLSLGKSIERVPYFEAFVDACTGRLLWFESTGRGCIVDEWRPQSCAGSHPTQKEDISPSPLKHSD